MLKEELELAFIPHGLTFGENKPADDYYQYMQSELKAHEDAKTWFTPPLPHLLRGASSGQHAKKPARHHRI
jgi:hypothetical protein